MKAWARFQDEGRRLYHEYAHAYLLSTDVASYFEYVDVNVLCDDLRALPNVSEPQVQALKRFLFRLTENTPFWGLPQGHDASAFLGNFYLLPVDTALRPHDVKAIRYQDDIKVFADDASTLRIALRRSDQVLRARHLNLSVAKTMLLEGDAVLREFEDARKDAIQYGIDARSSDGPRQLQELFDDAVRKEPFAARDIRFAVVRLAKFKDQYAAGWILEHLQEVPYLASHLVPYLSEHLAAIPDIEERVVAYLGDATQNIYP